MFDRILNISLHFTRKSSGNYKDSDNAQYVIYVNPFELNQNQTIKNSSILTIVTTINKLNLVSVYNVCRASKV